MIKRYSIYKNKILSDKRSKKFLFTIDNRSYYVYRVTNLTTLKYYYGSRIQKANNILEDFWSYGTSSSEKQNILLNRKNYKVKIINTFNNYNDCIIYESYLHQYFEVGKNNKFFNKSKQTPFDFVPDRTGMINCLTKDKQPCYISSVEYQENKDKYISYSSNKVTCFDVRFDKFVQIPKQEFEQNRENYLTTSQRITCSEKTKNKMSLSAKNRMKPNRSKTINIFNSKGVIIYTVTGKFKEFCKDNNLPFTALKLSYQNNGSAIYINSKDSIKVMANNKGWLPYFGWSAKEFNNS